MNANDFIGKWQPSGGAERANTQLFITDLCALIEVEPPQPAKSENVRNDYVFERNVIKTEIDGTTSNGWIDCYKRNSFILEAKQGSAADAQAVDAGHGDSLRDFFGQNAEQRFKRGMARRGTGQWTGAMQRAAGQAEGYAKALPADHGWPPFLLVTDVGYCIDVYSDFQRSGKGYAPFPDRRRFRITLEDLHDEKVRERLRDIWDRPMALDPSAEAARVTRGIAEHLATLARRIEAREQNPDRTAAFLMRLLFTMFAEDTGLIPKKSFSDLLKRVRDRPEKLTSQLSQLWTAMDKGGEAYGLGEAGETVRTFNGYLFKETTAIALEPGEIDVLIAAAEADWRQVEPAIFGTLLERALDTKERAKLGAHYTPRAYVERLVGPTIMDPLRQDWIGARAAATEAADAGDKGAARKIVETFHGKLAQTTVLDPACGTGNFLYVAMARMKELEGEVLELLEELGDDQYLAEISGHTITPENFLGIEINPRAANIAQLVLWIGYLQWHFRVNGEDRMPPDPVLRDVKTIENRDALITWDKRELEQDDHGRPLMRWDGETMKQHPVTGKNVPDETALVEVYRYVNPKPAKWPKADFIVGNPPFIGNKRMPDRLGRTYVDALRKTSRRRTWGADFVMLWVDRSAEMLTQGKTTAFGLVTTNSIKQSENRAVVEDALLRDTMLRIYFAVADHPWVDSADGADVRISMIVVDRSADKTGTLMVLDDQNISEDGSYEVALSAFRGRISPALSVGADVSNAHPLRANKAISAMGIILCGDGFFADSLEAATVLSDAKKAGVARRYASGIDLAQHARDRWVIDFTGYSEAEARSRCPSAYEWLLTRVLPERRTNPMARRREQWWLFGSNAPVMRHATSALSRYIATARTAKHRIFQFVSGDVLVESNIVSIASDDSLILATLSSRMHLVWAQRAGATLEDRPHYTNSTVFDPFPFPDPSEEAKAIMRDAAEKLDALRKEVLARHEDLTLTKLYNALEALRAAEKARTVLSDKDRDMATRGCVSLIRQYHDTIDAAVAEAYGCPADLTDEQILEKLVALNKVRAAEEAKGEIKWLRPEFQMPGYAAPKQQKTLALPETAQPSADILLWPSAMPDRFVAVAAAVDRAGKPIAAVDVAKEFKGTNVTGVRPVLDTLAGMGRLRKLEDGRYAA